MSKRDKGAEQAPEPKKAEAPDQAAPPPSAEPTAAPPETDDAPDGQPPEDPSAEPPKTLGDIARREIRGDKEAQRAAALDEERRKRRDMEARRDRILAEARELAKKTPKGARAYLVHPEGRANIVVRGRCFRPGQLFIAWPKEMAGHLEAERAFDVSGGL